MDIKGKSIKKYPVGSLGFELLHSTTLEYKIECLNDYTTEIRKSVIDEVLEVTPNSLIGHKGKVRKLREVIESLKAEEWYE